MRSEIPVWVVNWSHIWGNQKRRVWIGKDWFGNIDGYAQSLLGRIREERDGTGQGERKQHWPEVYWGRGLDVQRAIPGMRETPYMVGHLHYVWLPEWCWTIPQKAQAIGINKAEYWRELENFETWIHAKLDSVSPCESSKRPLQVVGELPTVRRISAMMAKTASPDINMAALKREKLTLKYADPEEAA